MTVEILDFWRSAGARRWLLVIAPLVAAAAAITVTVRAAPTYRTEASVVLPLNGEPPSPTIVRQIVANYRAVAVSPETIRHASAVAGISTGPLRHAISTEQPGDGNVVVVRATMTQPDKASAAADAVAREALKLMIRTELAEAAEAVDVAQRTYDEAATALVDYAPDAEIRPDTARNLMATDVSRLRDRLLQARLDGDDSRAATISGLLTEAEQQLAELERQATEYELLRQARARAEQVLTTVEQRLVGVRATSAYASWPQAVSLGPPEPTDRLAAMLQYVVAAVAVALVLGVAALLAWEGLAPRRTNVLSQLLDPGSGAAPRAPVRSQS